jgi:myo-inositol-1(or 4)-monophosphatase
MTIKDLMEIGRLLFAEIGKERLRPFETVPLGRGAGGDRTFPIDKKAEDIIIKYIEDLDEPLSIISEEAGIKELKGGGPIVMIDPIDGSKNAINGLPFYCTSIAVANGDTMGDVCMSIVVNLLTGDAFLAEKGKGAFFNGERIYAQTDDKFYLVAYEAPTPGTDIAKIMGLLSGAGRSRCFGAMALDLSYVAYGAISVFATPTPSRAFDFAGGYLLVKEAGGVLTDMAGSSIEGVKLDMKRSVPLLASGNKALHEKALRLLSLSP